MPTFLSLLAALALLGAVTARAQGAPLTWLEVADDATPARILTVLQSFPAGDVTGGLAATGPGGAALPLQLDVTTRHEDGSVRVALLSVAWPGGAGRIELRPTILAASAEAVRPPGPIPGDRLIVSVLGQAVDLGSADGTPWRQGPLVEERRRTVALAPGLILNADARCEAGAPACRWSLAFRNDGVFERDLRPRSYGVRVARGGRPLGGEIRVEQRVRTGWRMVVSPGGEVAAGGDAGALELPDLRRDRPYLVRAGALPDYDWGRRYDLPNARERIAEFRGCAPLANCGLTPDMGTTGGRIEIGLLPLPTAFALVFERRDLVAAALALGEAAGSAPWHVRDADRDAGALPSRHPRFWGDGRGPAEGRRGGPDWNGFDQQGWSVDVAHAGSLAYVPYLLTGDRHYLDETAYQAAWCVWQADPGFRRGRDLLVNYTQLRGFAWCLRELSNYAWVAPDADPLAGELRGVLHNNLDEMIARFVTGGAHRGWGPLDGWFGQGNGFDFGYAEQFAVWQYDFATVVLGWIVDRGGAHGAQARRLMAWMAPFGTGRYTKADPYFAICFGCRIMQPGGGPLTDWRQWERAQDDGPREPRPFKTDDVSYYAGGYAAVATWARLGVPGGRAALEAFLARVPDWDRMHHRDPRFSLRAPPDLTPRMRL